MAHWFASAGLVYRCMREVVPGVRMLGECAENTLSWVSGRVHRDRCMHACVQTAAFHLHSCFRSVELMCAMQSCRCISR